MRRSVAMWIVAVCAMLFAATSARAGDQDFTLVNKTGVEIHKVFVTPHDETHWGSDILKKDTFPNGAGADVKFHRDEEADDWDLKIEDKDGNTVTWHKLRLTKIHKIILHYDGKEATAEIE